ncbi:MAG TPA: hypothetical protein DD401_05305 [Prevotella sp.]|nr:hypothetical protein [Prevotella sp.]
MFSNMRINNIHTVLLVASLAAMTSCSNESLSEYERTKERFLDDIDGNIGNTQTWRTAVTIKANVTADAPVKLWLMSDNDKGTLYDYKYLTTSASVNLLAPQGQGENMYIVSVCNRNKKIHKIELTGKAVQNVDVDCNDDEAATENNVAKSMQAAKTPQVAADAQATVGAQAAADASLYGSSVAGNGKLYQFTTEQKNEAIDVLRSYYREKVPAKSLSLNCDYELESKGDFRITWFAGNCMSNTPHTLGYYYHSPGTYDDIKYVDISETEIYDYIDGYAKVQYKVNDRAAQKYGVEANRWYDANFDMHDTFENPHPSLWTRAGDDAYNSLDVYNRYGNDILALRGISFVLKVPAGMRVGFYDRIEDQGQPEQYDRFIKMGIKPYTTRNNFKAMNFSCEAMNMNMNGAYRSCVVTTKHAHWLGMENDYTGGDLDCNDVIFEVSADLDIYTPSVVEPDLEPFGEYDDRLPWTLAFEDVYRNADYDFNDAVIKLSPDYEKDSCAVTVMAAGTTEKMYLHYDGPDGDVCLGEIHQLLGGGNGCINTTRQTPQTDFVNIGNVAWPKTYNMKDDARRFYIEVKRGTCTDCSDILSLPDADGQLPQAVLVAGEWKWPLEGVAISKAYTSFAQWAKNGNEINHWKWYKNATPNSVVDY